MSRDARLFERGYENNTRRIFQRRALFVGSAFFDHLWQWAKWAMGNGQWAMQTRMRYAPGKPFSRQQKSEDNNF